MINFYNYFNFFYFNKIYFLNLFVCSSKFITHFDKNYFIFFVNINFSKIDIKNSIEFFLKIKIKKINTLIFFKNKIKKKKAYIYFNEFI